MESYTEGKNRNRMIENIAGCLCLLYKQVIYAISGIFFYLATLTFMAFKGLNPRFPKGQLADLR